LPLDEEAAMPAVSPDIAFCLQHVGRDRAGWDTFVVSGAADTAVPAAAVWAVWTDLEQWPTWSPLHRSVTRTSAAELAAGATFDQRISLGFPVGTTSQQVTIDLFEPGRRVSWSGDSGGVRSCHLWSFTPSPDGGTHVSNVEVFSGVMAAALRPLVAGRWNRQFQAAVDGLIRSAAGARTDAG
jgi:uncharacterized protein YndB with AHSA1/START domain